MTQQTKQPNIVFILIDDMGWMDLGFQGSTFYETPNLDRLAQQSMRFTDAYASCPVCSPTRASCLTGRYPARVQITNYIYGHEAGQLLATPYLDHLPLSEKTVATALRDGGYQTWHVGKWHLAGHQIWDADETPTCFGDPRSNFFPDKHGFDVNIGGSYHGYLPGGYFAPFHDAPGLDKAEPGEYLPDFLTRQCKELIETRDESKPFFLNLWYHMVHTPIQGKPELVAKYEKKAAALGLDQIDPLVEGEPDACRDKNIVRRVIQSDPAYAAMVQSLDENIGLLLASLEEQGILDDTIVVFTSDNGGLSTSEGSPTCNAPLSEGKGWMYEGGTREPMIVRWPGVTKPDSLCDVPVTSTDFFPTFLTMAGLPQQPEAHCDGLDLTPILRGESAELDRDGIFWHYPHYGNQGGTPGCSVRSGDWKLIRFFEDDHLELYNLREDLGEDNNLAQRRPDVVTRLQDMLNAWLADVGAKFPERNPDWTPLQ